MVQEAGGAVSLLQQLRADKADAGAGGSVIVDTKRQAAVVHTAQLQSAASRASGGGGASRGPLLLHVVRGPPKVRAGFESESKKLGFLRIGDVIEVLETKVNDRGQTRVRCAEGWVSLTAKDGSRLLVEDQNYERAPALSEQLAGSGVVYRCLKKSVLRSGMDKLSERVGTVEEGEQVTAAEVRVCNGQVRIRIAGRGWTSLRNPSGGQLLKREANGSRTTWGDGDGQERAVSFLTMKGCSAEVAEHVCSVYRDQGLEPAKWTDTLVAMSEAELEIFLREAADALARQAEVAAVMSAAGELMVQGEYAEAKERYLALCTADDDALEARRGVTEAEKGLRLAAMSPEDLMREMEAAANAL
eukprot:COSAG02_NODE_2117_length_9786_cov_7.559203_4_plen_359_part_00